MQPKEPKPLPKMIRDEDDKNSNKPNKIIFGKKHLMTNHSIFNTSNDLTNINSSNFLHPS